MSNSIPVMRKPADAMSKGLNSSNLAAAAQQRHPIDRMQRATASNGATESPLDLDAIRRLYGSGLAMRLATERQMALKVGGRLPGLDAHPDSRAMYETLTGDDVSIGFGDYLNLRRNRPEGETSEEPLTSHTLLWNTSWVSRTIVTMRICWDVEIYMLLNLNK